MKNIIITGGRGFVGSHLSEALSATNNVLVIDNLFNPSTYKIMSNVRYCQGSSEDIQEICDRENFNPDQIFHLGEYSRVETSFDDIDLVLELNRRTFGRVLTCAKNYGAKLIYSASSTLFATGGTGYISSPYEIIKKENVETLKWYAELTGLSYAITYFYNVFGEGEKGQGKYATVVARFLEQQKLGAPLTVRLPGTQQRNFTHVKDVTSALILVSDNGHGDGYAIGNETAISIDCLARLISDNIEYLPETVGNRQTAHLDLGKMTDLGWAAQYSIFSYIQDNLNIKL